jgi:hypothetical protein
LLPKDDEGIIPLSDDGNFPMETLAASLGRCLAHQFSSAVSVAPHRRSHIIETMGLRRPEGRFSVSSILERATAEWLEEGVLGWGTGALHDV